MVTKILLQIFPCPTCPQGDEVTHYVASDKEAIDFLNKKFRELRVPYQFTDLSEEDMECMHKYLDDDATFDFYLEFVQIQSQDLCLRMITDLTQVQCSDEHLAPIATTMAAVLKQVLKR